MISDISDNNQKIMTENSVKIKETSVAVAPVTKRMMRRKVWEHLEQNNLVNFPRPVYGRIPNFKGCETTATKVTELDVFKNAQNIKVNPDKPQEPVRFSVLEHQKNLFVPIPKLQSGLLKHIMLPENSNKDSIHKAVSRRGIDNCGTEVGLNDDTKIDLVILGSVAVSKEGYRIGKGKGYADLEFAILMHMKAVNQNTIVLTTIHDSQLFDTLPSELFGPHDVPVDIIVTPTQVIYVEKPLPKPSGIIWSLLSQRRIEIMPVLKALREIDEKNGKDVTLKEINSDVENNFNNKRRTFRRSRRFRYNNRRSKNEDSLSREPGEKQNGAENDVEKDVNDVEGEKRTYRKRKFIKKKTNGAKEADRNGESKENANPNVENGSPEHKRKPRRNMRKNRPMIDFSLVVRNIGRNVRVRDLKAALTERGIKPNIITWRGYKGFCCLHFSKTNPNTISDPEQQSHGVDSVLNLLSDLKITPNDKKELVVEIMKPISRIETTDVTAV